MPRQYKLEKVVPFAQPAPGMPEGIELAMSWLNAHAGQGWHHPQLTIDVDGSNATLGPVLMIRDEPHLLLVNDGARYEYKLEQIVPFVRPMPQMPDPVELALGWLNGHAEQGWEGPQVELQFTKAGDMETMTMAFAETVDVNGTAKVLFRRELPAG